MEMEREEKRRKDIRRMRKTTTKSEKDKRSTWRGNLDTLDGTTFNDDGSRVKLVIVGFEYAQRLANIR